MIKTVIHIADIHIPNMEDKRPYSEMLKKFLSELYKEIKDLNRDEVRIVIVGDIFHQKIKASNEASIMFHDMLNYLNAMAKTYIVAGNHDMLENNHDRKDSITPTFQINGAYPNITYMDRDLSYKSGCIVDDGIIWALFSMHESFAKPSVEALKELYPNHKVIGLYHGEVVGAKTDNGRMCENGIDVNDFKDCDCVMAGHIHRYQTIKKNGIPIVYSGSLFQQDSDENVTGHGYVVWNIDNMKYNLHEVTNDYKIYKFKISSFDDVDNDEERLINL